MDGTQQEAPSQVIINGQEYDPGDAQQLIELGNKYREMESKLNTSLDKVYPEYTKATQKLSQLERELAETREYKTKWEQAEQEKNKTKETSQVPQDKQAALKAAREMGLADQDWIKENGYLTKKELDDYWNAKTMEQNQVQTVLKQGEALESKIDGSDGRVPFVKEAVLAYASVYKINDLEEAYNKMNERPNAKWQQAQIEAAKKKGLTTLKGGGQKLPPAPGKFTDDNVKDRLREALWGGAEE